MSKLVKNADNRISETQSLHDKNGQVAHSRAMSINSTSSTTAELYFNHRSDKIKQ